MKVKRPNKRRDKLEKLLAMTEVPAAKPADSALGPFFVNDAEVILDLVIPDANGISQLRAAGERNVVNSTIQTVRDYAVQKATHRALFAHALEIAKLKRKGWGKTRAFWIAHGVRIRNSGGGSFYSRHSIEANYHCLFCSANLATLNISNVMLPAQIAKLDAHTDECAMRFLIAAQANPNVK